MTWRSGTDVVENEEREDHKETEVKRSNVMKFANFFRSVF